VWAFLVQHDLFGKLVATYPGHALSPIIPARAPSGRRTAKFKGYDGRRSDVATQFRLGLERDGFSLNRHRALDLWWSMVFSENRYPLFRIML
jgi:hypothetical protein